uniref:Capsid protein n=1 Tax=viral metagenome TaxID=1070528 RepID=A0A6H1ZQU1_9ZZZZ
MPAISTLRNASPYLTGWTRAYYQEKNFVADKAMTPFNVPNEVDKYATINNDHYRYDATNTDMMLKSTDKSTSSEFDIGVSSATYNLQLYREHHVVGRLEGDAASQKNIKLKETKTRGLKHHMSVYKETQFASFLFGSTNYASTNKAALSGSGIWSAAGNMGEAAFYSAYTPKYVVRSAIDTVRKTSGGLIVNKMIVGAGVHKNLTSRADFLKFLATSSDVGYDRQNRFLADLFGVDEYMPLLAVSNSAMEGATDSMGDIGGAFVALIYQPNGAVDLDAPFGMNFNRETFPFVAEWVDDWRMGATVVENYECYQFKSVSTVSGFLLTTVVS